MKIINRNKNYQKILVKNYNSNKKQKINNKMMRMKYQMT